MEPPLIHPPDPPPIPQETVASIARKLGRRKAAIWQEGERDLQSLGPQGLDVLLSILETERQKFHRRNAAARFLYRLSWAIWWIGFSLITFCISLEKKSFLYPLLTFCLMGGQSISSFLLSRSRLYYRAKRLLTGYKDVRSVPTLIDNLERENPDVREALIELLPQLKASDASLLNDRQRNRLYYMLKLALRWDRIYLFERDLTVAILKGLEQIGDRTALPLVEKIARSARHQSIKFAAENCLPYLREHVRQQDQEETLLRASSLSASPEELLRPAAHVAETPPEQMLRAASSTE